jgi:prevent-host-death family protein
VKSPALTRPSMLDIMSNMKTINVRELQHGLGRVLDQVERGETIEVRRRNKPVARIVPMPAAAEPQPWPDIMARLKKIYGDRMPSPSGCEIIDRDRDHL